jgi:hypothetical protein
VSKLLEPDFWQMLLLLEPDFWFSLWNKLLEPDFWARWIAIPVVLLLLLALYLGWKIKGGTESSKASRLM